MIHRAYFNYVLTRLYGDHFKSPIVGEVHNELHNANLVFPHLLTFYCLSKVPISVLCSGVYILQKWNKRITFTNIILKWHFSQSILP